MRRIWLAIRVFFLVLFRRETARSIERLLADGVSAEAPPARPGLAPAAEQSPRGGVVETRRPAAAKPPARSEAIALLAALQREARFVDFVMEPLGGYTDAQIGAAARDIQRGCAAVVQRMFDMRPVLAAEEGAAVDVPAGFDAGRYRLTGNVSGAGPFRGRLVHRGWEAARCELPDWTGSDAAARVVAPAEVELA